MAASVTVRSNYSATSYGQAVMRALNRSAKAVNTDLARALSAATSLQQSYVRERLAIVDARKERLESRVLISGKRVPLIRFGARQNARGVVYRLKGGRGFVLHGFVATMRSGHRGAWRRLSPSRSRRGKPRGAPQLPVAELTGPSMARAAARSEVLTNAAVVGRTAILKNLTHELNQMFKSRAA